VPFPSGSIVSDDHLFSKGHHFDTLISVQVGYSSKSLTQKLGLKKDQVNAILWAPANLPEDYQTFSQAMDNRLYSGKEYDFIHAFVSNKSKLVLQFPTFKKKLREDGMLWISWPKGTSKLETDLNENIIREVGLSHGLVDVKVIAVDEDWSGLKFVYRLKDRS
jgi:hypothetical protein